MSDRQKRIDELEDRNSEHAKEILLNEVAIDEARRDIAAIDEDIIDHPSITDYCQHLCLLIDRLEQQNNTYRVDVFKNNWEIKRLEEND